MQLSIIPDESHHQPPVCDTKYSLGIDLGASKVRYEIYSKDNPGSAEFVDSIDHCVSFSKTGQIRVGYDPCWTDFAPVPSCQRFIGRMFNDPAIATSRANYPLPIFEHPDSHTCVIDIGPQHPGLTPESVVQRVLRTVRKTASKAVGEDVVDATIAVPTLFTSAQRAAVRNSAEWAGLRVVHIISSTLASALAMKKSEQLTAGGHTVIVDVGASKIEMALLLNTHDSVREIRTEGTDAVGSDDIAHSIVHFLGMSEQFKLPNRLPFTLAKLTGAIQRTLERGDHEIRIADFGDGEEFHQMLDDEMIEQAQQPVISTIHEIVQKFTHESDVGVLCIGGGTRNSKIMRQVKKVFRRGMV
jgi:molecular chaperone DnaK (HSP70)